MKCPEDPQKLSGQPIGMYHCPYCGCMQMAGLPHMCLDDGGCLLEKCFDCGKSKLTISAAWFHTDPNEDEEHVAQWQ